jgi:hypothetical protein
LQVDNDENEELKTKSERNEKGNEIILEFKKKNSIFIFQFN